MDNILFYLIVIIFGIVYVSSRIFKGLARDAKKHKQIGNNTEEPNIYEKYSGLSCEEIIFHSDIDFVEKTMLLEENYGYSVGNHENGPKTNHGGSVSDATMRRNLLKENVVLPQWI